MIKVKLHPYYDSKKPRTIERAQKLALNHFNKTGNSNHSGMGMLLPFIINYCEENGISYTLKAVPGQGYYIERMNNG